MRKFLFGMIVLIIILATLVVIYLFKQEGGEVKSQEDLALNNQNYYLEDEAVSYRSIRAIDDSDHVLGNPENLNIIIYCDFECPFCLDFQTTFAELKKEFGNKITIAYRHFPLSSHENAVASAEASECASEQGKFWEMHDKLFEDSADFNFNKEEFLKDAEELDLDVIEFDKCLFEGRYRDQIYLEMADARTFGVSGTPTIFVGDIILPGAYPMEDFVDSEGVSREGLRKIIADELSKYNAN